MAKNILILGGNGFLGQNLVLEFCKNKNYNVFVYDISKPKHRIENITYYVGDLDQSQNIIEIMYNNQINVLIHMISTIIPGSLLDDYVANCKIVQLNTIPLLDYCSKNSILLVYFSSGGTVYGVKGGKIREDEPTAPISYYGLSKVQIEDLINFYHRRYGMNYLILRPSNPYGCGQNLYGKQGLIAVIMGKLLKDEPIKIFGDGETIRDYIYIDDFVYYVSELISNEVLNETINIGSGEGFSINHILSIVNNLCDGRLKIDYIEARKDDVPNMILDVTRLHNFVKHSNRTLQEGIKAFFEASIK